MYAHNKSQYDTPWIGENCQGSRIISSRNWSYANALKPNFHFIMIFF
jgi:hypothetical protein